MINQLVSEAYQPKVLSASANIMVGQGALGGIFVASASNTPTITIYDDAATGTSVPLVTVFTPVAGTYYKLPYLVGNGIYVVITGTISCTAGFLPRN